MSQKTNVVDVVFALFRDKGQGAYFGEPVTETEHALQCANLAVQSGATSDLIVAALLHDLGHLLHGLPEDIAERGLDGRHEEGGFQWLSRFFGPAIVDPVRLHVAAKRYLCAVEPQYHAGLSPASQQSLRLQGGAMSADEMRQFEDEPHSGSAIAVRRWDDAAKIPGLAVPGLEDYRPYLQGALAGGARMKSDYDVGVVGAGILGLAHAYHLARRGMRVVVFERHPRAQGASVRNFGMIWPIGQPLGRLYQLARRSQETWLEVLRASGLWHQQCGSLHLAYHDDEAQVLREFVAEASPQDRPCELWSAAQVAMRHPAIVQTGLREALWSPTELAVDPREVIAKLPAWLSRTYGVDFAFGTPVLGSDLPRVRTAEGDVTARRLVICTGADFRELAPTAFANSGLVPCKLQMMRSQAFGDAFQVGTHLAAGLTLRHYASFVNCPTLPALARRFDAEMPEYHRHGIHVLVSRNGIGELTIGDSHEYGDAIEPFDKPRIDELILDYLKSFLRIPNLTIAARWHGVYVKHPKDAYVVAHPAPNMIAVTGVGGAGMTLSFGLAERIITDWLGECHD